MIKLYNKTNHNSCLSETVIVADTFTKRLKGLLGKKTLPAHQCLWIKDCPSVHTFFMKFPIDVVFVNKTLKVTKIHKNLKPWRMTPILQFKNNSCFEFKAGSLPDDLKLGDQLDVHS